jgi:hypothetical protein
MSSGTDEPSKPTPPRRHVAVAAIDAIAGDNARPGYTPRPKSRYTFGGKAQDRQDDRPQIVCPNCRIEIRLTDSVAAPLIADARRQFEQQLAAREADFGRREAGLKKTQ